MKGKRLISLLISLILVLSLIPALPAFAEDYGLKVCGVTVTSANCDSLVGGKVQYAPGSKTLYIKGDLNNSTGILDSSVDGLTVIAAKSDGSAVKLTSSDNDALILRSTTYFKNCNMIVKATDEGTVTDSAFYALGEYLWFIDSTVEAQADYTLSGSNTQTCLKIRNSNLKVSCDNSDGRAVGNFRAGIEFINCYLIKPEGGKLNSANDTIVNADGTKATYVEISDTLYYDLWIAGTQVTSKNQYNVLGDGKFQFYEPSTLVIKGDCTCDGNVIYNEIDGLKISTDAPSDAVCQLISQSKDTIVSTGNLTFSAAKLSLSTYGGGNDDSAIYMKGSNTKLTFSHSGIYASGDYTVYGEYDTSIDCSYTDLKVDATDRAVAGFSGGITFDQSYIEKPAGAVVNTNGIMESDGSNYAKNVVIKAGTAYDITIAGVRVNTFNCGDVLGDGVFKYDNASKKLTINGNCSYAYAIVNSEISNLKIVIKGDSKLTTTAGSSTFFLKGNTVIQAENGSKLTVESGNAGFNFKSGTGLEFQNLDLTVTAPVGIVGNENGSLSFTNSVADITTTSGAVYGFEAINLTGCVLVEPEGGKIDGGAIVNADGSQAKHVVIGEPPVEYYDLWIDGVQVTSENALDVLGNGCFAYRKNENRLTLSKSYTGTSAQVIRSEIPNLTIYLPNDFTYTSNNDVISLGADTRIIGPGTLTVNSNGNCGIFVRAGATLTLENADVVAEGEWGIAGTPGGEKLIVKNSTVKAKGASGAICDFDGGITLTGSSIVKPIGGKIGASAIENNDGSVATEVELGAALVNPFKDIKPEDYWYNPVLWAYYHSPQITTGTSADKFSPNNTCTRAQIVTFLWRAKGEPEPTLTVSPFVDVQDPSQYYYKAVLWAVENGITTGTDATHFSPGKGCTRAQVVTFQWRANGKPAPSTTVNPFTDVKADQYYYDAVLWAVGKGVTTGTSADKFSPDKTCTRGQIVTFLYRDLS